MTLKYHNWRKASHGEPNGGCVEVARSDTIGVRDTKANGTGPILDFTSTEWTTFLTALRPHP